MTGRSNFIEKALWHKAAYWGGAKSDGAGGRTFDTAISLACRWEDKAETFIDATGRETASSSVVYVNTELATGGYIALVDVVDLTPAQVSDPFQVPGAREIRQFDKIPGLRDDTVMLRRAWL